MDAIPYARGGGLGGASTPRATQGTAAATGAALTTSRTAVIAGGVASACDASVTSADRVRQLFIDGDPSPVRWPSPAGQSTHPQSWCAS